MEQETHLTLSQRDLQKFTAKLDGDLKPNDALKDAIEATRQIHWAS